MNGMRSLEIDVSSERSPLVRKMTRSGIKKNNEAMKINAPIGAMNLFLLLRSDSIFVRTYSEPSMFGACLTNTFFTESTWALEEMIG